ncbi:MAG: dockerin type I domain-containing protein [Phycisphaerales bacterium]|nr:dockerin type I domain-containing protein [Phycisphaerales bacterium]
MFRVLVACAVALATVAGAGAQTSFVNWETPHVHPLDMTPDGSRLLAVNTADNRLEVFTITSSGLTHTGSIPVGLDPVTVRLRSDDQAWVVNHVSDSISIVDLSAHNVVSTLWTADEPCDVVFAGSPPRAFVTCSQANRVQVFDPLVLDAAPIDIAIVGEDPRALAVSPDGSTVYAAVFESGNRTTILGGGATTLNFFPPNVVSHASGPYGGQNPPPNMGQSFQPPLNPDNPPPPAVGLIVRKNDQGVWLDDNGGDWTEFVSGSSAGLSGRPVGWDLWDHDLAQIDAQTLEVSYRTGLMNLCMAIAVNPSTGQITVVGTEAINQVRFESNLNGRFLRTQIAVLDAAGGSAPQITDINPHLTYTQPTVEQSLRDLSIGDPRGIVWNAAGTLGYIAGMGSNNMVVVDAAGERSEPGAVIEVGQGPTGVAIDEAQSRLYVLNKFEATISVIDAAKRVELDRVSLFDPTPASIRLGRPHLYNAHETSGLGHISCASCHPDGRMDRLAWDLGDPSGQMIPFDQNCNFGSAVLGAGPCPDWHPMKGPMVTQTLQDIIGKEPHHWRGDRDGIEEFDQTFMNLQGDDQMLTEAQMQELENLLATIALPPNPFRNLNNTLPTSLPLPGQYYTGVGGAPGTPLPSGNASAGFGDFLNHHLVQGFAVSCSTCHTLPTGVGTNMYTPSGGGGLVPFPPGPNGELHHTVVFSALSETPSMSIKVVQLRNLHEKIGFEMTQQHSVSGFGFLHDGSVDSLARFMGNPPFIGFTQQIDGPPSVKVPRMVAFMMAFSGSDLQLAGVNTPPGGPLSRDAHAAVGRQITFNASNADPILVAQLNALIAIADTPPDNTPGPRISLVAKGLQQNIARGYAYAGGGQFQSDRQSESVSTNALIAAAGGGAEVTFTAVPFGTQTRIGIDRDEDGYFDRDELDAGSDPADPNSVPAGPGDANGDGIVNIVDLLLVINAWGPCASPCAADFNADGLVNIIDLLTVISNWG